MPEDQRTIENRVRASWRVRACTAGLCTGAQVFLLGTGAAMPLALNGAWIASLCALPAAALVALCGRRACAAPRRDGPLSRALFLLLGATLLLCAVFALASLVNLAGETLLVQARAAWIAAYALAACALCACFGGTGVGRLCFSLRWMMPLLLGLAALAQREARIEGLFPLLGTGGRPLLAACACMLGASAPALLLMLPPPELREAGEAARACPVPGAGFFVVRVLAGAAVGVLLLFAASVCTTYEAIEASGEWGVRLHIVADTQAHEGVTQTLLTVLELTATELLAAATLSAAEQAIVRALPAAGRHRAGLAALVLLLAAALSAMTVNGFVWALYAAPLLFAPALVLALCHGRLGDRAP